jgi:preprotein translocase subunit YajC
MTHFISLIFNSVFFQSAVAQTAEVATTAATQPTAPQWMQFVPFAVIIVVFYFFLIRPQAKKQKETQNFLVSLKVGDLIVTNAGILGRITNLTDTVATIEVANTVQIKILRSQIATSQEFLKASAQK